MTRFLAGGFLAVGISLFPPSASAQTPTTLTIEVVDDSGSGSPTSYSPYLLLFGKDIPGVGPMDVDATGGQLAFVDLTTTTTNVTPLVVSALPSAGYSIISPYTGLVRPVYRFKVTTIGSGVVYVFHNDGGTAPFIYQPAPAPPATPTIAPSPTTANYRFDLCELTFHQGGGITSGGDLTSIDAFSMPMQWELFDGVVTATSKPVDARYYYRSTASILAEMQSIGIGAALFQQGSAGAPVSGWMPSAPPADPLSTFVRALGPGQAAALSSTGNPAPYPSFAGYLQRLTDIGTTFTVGDSPTGTAANDYQYTGSVSSDGHGGYQMVLTGHTGTQPSPFPDSQQVTIHLPTNQVSKASASVDPTTGAIQMVSVNIPGSGYSNPPIVKIGGPPAAVNGTARAVINSAKIVTKLLLTNGGSNYYSLPVVTVNPPQNPGTQATVTPTISGGVITGFVVTDPGSGYTAGTTGVTISAPPAVAPATATATVSGGAVTSITVDVAGAGYINTPPVTVDPPPGSMDTFLYGAALSADAYSVATVPRAAIQLNSNTAYGSIVRDAFSGINFGYLDGRYGTEGPVWYGTAPTAFPFGRARLTNDGYYNPWAALFYNFSDAYSFAFSDRSGPSPLLDFQAGQTLRITILPDVRLDSPRPYVTQAKTDSLEIEWPAVSGASQYLITVLAPSGVLPQTIAAVEGINGLTLAGLQPGTPYTFTVAAMAPASNGNPLITPAQPVQYSTAGTPAPPLNTSIPFAMSMSWSPPQYILARGAPSVTFNNATPGTTLIYQTTGATAGQWLAAGLNAAFTGKIGKTEYVMSVNDGLGNLLFTNIIAVELAGSASSFTVTSATVYGVSQPLSQAPPNPPYSTSNPLTLGISFPPEPLKAFAPALRPGKTYAEWASGYPSLGAAGGVSDDPDGDGLSNLQEYFQGTNPEVPGLFMTDTADLNGDQLVLRFRKSKSLSGVFAQAEWSTDLQTWQTTGVTYDPEQDAGDHLECAARVSAATADKMFFRLNVSIIFDRPGRGSKLPSLTRSNGTQTLPQAKLRPSGARR